MAMRDPFFPTRTRKEIAADNRVELDQWIDERAAALAEHGMGPAEARRRAIEEFGNIAAAEEYGVRQDVAADRRIRAGLWLEGCMSDLRIAFRSLARTPIVTTVTLLTFALGVGAATAVFSVVHAMLLHPLPYGDEERLVQLQPVENGVVRPLARFSAAALVALRERTTSFAGISAIETGNAVLTENGDTEQLAIATLTPEGFEVLQARAAVGRTFDSTESGRVAVLLDGLWRRRFGGDPTVVGRTIDLAGGRREVIGVMSPGFRVPTYEAAEFVTLRDVSVLLRSPNTAQIRALRLFGRLRPGVSVAAAQADVDRAMRWLEGAFPRSFAGIETRIVDIRTAVAGDARPRLFVLMGAGAFVMLIACANVAGILLSRGVARRHELSVRVVLGAGRRRLIRQFLAEGTVLAILGAGLGLLIAQLGIVLLQGIAAAAFPAGTAFALEPGGLMFAIVAAAVAGLAAASVPALRATYAVDVFPSRSEGRSSLSLGNRRLRLGLVAAQLAVSVVLLAGAGLLIRTLHQLWTIDVGYATEHALTFRLPFVRPMSGAAQDAFWTSLFEQLRAVPGVMSTGAGNVPMSGQSTVVGLEVEGRLVEQSRLPEVRYTFASEHYFATLGIPVVRGRVFNAADTDGAPPVAVVSAGLANQLWPGADPIGTRVRAEPTKPWSTIVGVVGDVGSGAADTPLPSIYTSHSQDRWPAGGPVVVRAQGDPGLVISGIRAAVRRVDPTLPVVGLRTLEDFRRGAPAIAERRIQMQLLLMFAVVAFAVSAIGVYGAGAYATEARRREFGIRMALGATQGRVLWLALRDGALVAVLGALAGVPIAVWLASRLRGMLYATSPFDPPTLIGVIGALAVVVLAASVVPARRATRIDPASTMRTD
jgi:putative ABC transport system permease protein